MMRIVPYKERKEERKKERKRERKKEKKEEKSFSERESFMRNEPSSFWAKFDF